MTGKEFHAAVQSLSKLRFHRVLRDTKLFGDFTMGEIFKFTQNKNFTAARWQLRNRSRKEVGLLMTASILCGIRRVVDDARVSNIRYRNRISRSPTTKQIARGIAGSSKKKPTR